MLAVNGFLPGSLKIIGPDVDMDKARDYVGTATRRAAQAGVETIVFGSGRAREIPDGFDADEAWRQLVIFTRMAAREAATRGVRIVVEPLRASDCNFINTVGEAAALVAEVNHPNACLLVDSFHWACDNDSAEAIIENGKAIHHVHVATRDHRLPPGGEPYDWAPFYSALKTSNYDGTVSIEAHWEDLSVQAGAALDALRRHVSSA